MDKVSWFTLQDFFVIGKSVHSVTVVQNYSFCYAGKDVIGLAETGSGKTGAFAIPILQALLETPQKLFALVMTPTRELAYQISEQFDALGTSIGIKCGEFITN